MKAKRILSERKVKDNLFVLSVLILPILSFIFLYLYVNLNSFALAFQSIDITGKTAFVGLQNFKDFFVGLAGNSQVALCLKNSLKMWWLNFIITMPLYLLFAYYVFKKDMGNRFFSIMVMIPQIISAFVFALVYKKFVEVALPNIMESLGYKDFPQLIYDERYAFGNNVFFTCWLSFGTSVLVYSNAMNSISHEIIESAQIDGAGNFREFFNIVLPQIWPTMTTFVVTGAAGMFTASGSLLTFYMYTAPPSIQGLGYYFTAMVKKESTLISSYPALATSGFVVTLITAPVVYLVKYIMNKLDKTESV